MPPAAERIDMATDDPSQRVKRRRVALACDACRMRKSKCDGARPQCTICISMGFECNYTPPSSCTNLLVGKDYLQSLESRIALLENHMGSVKSHLVDLSEYVQEDRNTFPPARENCELGPATSESLPDLANIEDPIDGMGAVVFADKEDYGFFGPSSNIAFLRHLYLTGTNDVRRQQRPNLPGTRSGGFEFGFVNVSRPPSPVAKVIGSSSQNQPLDLFALPPRLETWELVQKYFSDTGLLFPYIYPPTFLETCQHVLKRNPRRIRRTWLGLLNIMLAMVKITAAPETKPAEIRLAEANMFYQRALGLCGNEMLRGTTIEVVQFLLLMGQYLQGTQKSVQAWTIHGLAVKAALQLGLHSKDAAGAFTPADQEVRRRTWFACVILDRTLSMTLGRPATIPDNYVRLELPKHDDDLVVPMVDPRDVQMSTLFFNNTILLYKQLFVTIDELYDQNLGCESQLSVSEKISKILSISQTLEAWKTSLPEGLGLVTVQELQNATRPAPEEPQFSFKFRVILTLRYLHLQVLLHRPILVQYIDACVESSANQHEQRVLQQIGWNSLQICSEAAMNIIDLVYEVLDSTEWHKSLLGAWWFTLYYTFHSALILRGTLWVCRDGDLAAKPLSCGIEQLVLYPSRAVQALYKLDSGNRIVDRCRYYLERLTNISNTSNGSARSDKNQAEASSSFVNAFDSNINYSPLGLEFGEFMLDGDFWAAMIQEEPSADQFAVNNPA
ncbi:C6 transcription factor [Talaromyces proteolyticus]|uniref:C6 transcription factor n=1 Tax=Talaromyces proteolyticus TaxID=1131652 RepID=A0AAD4KUM5_9EURO|nr:C6 transcription factor [Talaromyces proteolyticus]KAH8700315.1 C6 transcription factor [Talaromyces proteolyticus]